VFQYSPPISDEPRVSDIDQPRIMDVDKLMFYEAKLTLWTGICFVCHRQLSCKVWVHLCGEIVMVIY